MAIRMIGLDLDGTLFDSRKRLTKYTRQVLEQAIAQGILIVPSTGRPRIGLPENLLEIPGIRYAVVANGSAIYDLKENRFLYQNCMDREAAADLMRRTRRLGHTVQGAFLGEWGYMEAEDSVRIEQLPACRGDESLPAHITACGGKSSGFDSYKSRCSAKAGADVFIKSGRESSGSGGSGEDCGTVSAIFLYVRWRWKY